MQPYSCAPPLFPHDLDDDDHADTAIWSSRQLVLPLCCCGLYSYVAAASPFRTPHRRIVLVAVGIVGIVAHPRDTQTLPDTQVFLLRSFFPGLLPGVLQVGQKEQNQGIRHALNMGVFRILIQGGAWGVDVSEFQGMGAKDAGL